MTEEEEERECVCACDPKKKHNNNNNNTIRTKVGNGRGSAIAATRRLKHDRDVVTIVFVGLEHQRIILVHHFEDLAHIGRIDAQTCTAITTIRVKRGAVETDRHECDMSAVHGLDTNVFLGAVHIRVGQQVLDGLDNVFENGPVLETRFEHDGKEDRGD